MRTVPPSATELIRREAMITAGVVDDEVLVRGGIRSVLERDGDVTVVGESGDGAGAIGSRHSPTANARSWTGSPAAGATCRSHARSTCPKERSRRTSATCSASSPARTGSRRPSSRTMPGWRPLPSSAELLVRAITIPGAPRRSSCWPNCQVDPRTGGFSATFRPVRYRTLVGRARRMAAHHTYRCSRRP